MVACKCTNSGLFYRLCFTDCVFRVCFQSGFTDCVFRVCFTDCVFRVCFQSVFYRLCFTDCVLQTVFFRVCFQTVFYRLCFTDCVFRVCFQSLFYRLCFQTVFYRLCFQSMFSDLGIREICRECYKSKAEFHYQSKSNPGAESPPVTEVTKHSSRQITRRSKVF